MDIQKDLHTIEDLAMLKQDENWRFRVFLKGYDIPSKKLNAMVLNFARAVSEKIDCTTCGNCCKRLEPVLDVHDIRRISEKLEISEEIFRETYLTCDPEGDIIFKQRPCPFLKNNRCVHYSSRPAVCRSYPHLNDNEFLSRLIKVVQNTSICPIVFNVYEGMKEKLREPFLKFEEEYMEEY